MRVFWKLIMLTGVLFSLLLPVNGAESAAAVVEMNVLEIGKGSGSVAASSPHVWYIRCHILEESREYTILQTLSPHLKYYDGSLKVSLILENQSEIPLNMEEHYTQISGSVFTEQGLSDRISITLTDSGKQLIHKNIELRLTYEASLKPTTPVGEQILGSAQLFCTDEEGIKTCVTSQRASIRTGGISIMLTDSSGAPLSGGEFMLARQAREDELNDPQWTVELLDIGNETIAVVYLPFCTNRDLLGPLTYTAVTNADGSAGCYGLAHGEYYLVQTHSDLIPALPICVTISEVSHLTDSDGWTNAVGEPQDNTLRIINNRLTMPKTGGPGTRIYTLSGIAVIVSACMLIWFNRKRTLLY